MEKAQKPQVTSLSDFIRSNMESILVAWDEFAQGILVARQVDIASARDHAKGMMLAVVDDMDSSQSAFEQVEKSKGRGPQSAGSAAAFHGTARMLAGFTAADEVSEFRALRASVLQLWSKANAITPLASNELIRFNESIDQALAESIEQFSANREQTARQFETLMSASPDIYCLLDIEGKFIFANKTLTSLYGKKLNEMMGRSFFDFVASVSTELRQQMDEVVKSRTPFHGNMPFTLLCGKTVTFEYFLVPVSDDGNVTAIALAARDMTIRQQLENDLRKEKEIADKIIEGAPGPFFMIDEKTNLVRWNSELRRETGLSDDQLRGSSILAAIDERDRPLAAAKFMAAFAIGYASMEVRAPTCEQGIRYFLKTARRLMVDGVPYVAGFCVDITDRRIVEQSLEKEMSFSNALIEGVPGAFYVVDMEGNYFRWNSYLNKLTGLTDIQLRQQPALLTIHEEDRQLAAETMKKAFEEGYAQAEMRVHTHERGVRLYLMTARPFRVGNQKYLVGVGTDTTDWLNKMKALEHEAWTDPLTNVVNRGHFMELARLEFARSRRYGHALSLWMLDIDHFKAVNDTFGHQAGDIALQFLVTTCHQMLRDWDILGRFGGEEFCVLLPETEISDALLVAERLRQTVGTSTVPLEDGKFTHLTVSIGIATAQEGDADLDALIARADLALYEAKRTGRDKVCLADGLATEWTLPHPQSIAAPAQGLGPGL